MSEAQEPRFVVLSAGLRWLVRDSQKMTTVKVYKSLRCAHKRAAKENNKCLTSK